MTTSVAVSVDPALTILWTLVKVVFIIGLIRLAAPFLLKVVSLILRGTFFLIFMTSLLLFGIVLLIFGKKVDSNTSEEPFDIAKQWQKFNVAIGPFGGLGDKKYIKEHKGLIGELHVAKILTRLPKDVYSTFHDFYVPGSRDSAAQIDHAVVSRYGIFVMETKKFDVGHLYGSAKDYTWTLVMGKKREKPRNPLRQNERHIVYLAEHLGMSKRKFHSVICFTGKADIKTRMPDNVLTRDWDNYILSFREPLLSEREERYVVNEIKKLKSDPHLEGRHERYLQRRHNKH